MSRCSDRVCVRTFAGVLACAMLLSACSDIYYDRRETVLFGAGDAVATNRIVQTADPWPAAAADRRLTYSGNVAAAAAERYRTGQVIQPRGSGTSAIQWQQQQQQAQQPVQPSLMNPVATTAVK